LDEEKKRGRAWVKYMQLLLSTGFQDEGKWTWLGKGRGDFSSSEEYEGREMTPVRPQPKSFEAATLGGSKRFGHHGGKEKRSAACSLPRSDLRELIRMKTVNHAEALVMWNSRSGVGFQNSTIGKTKKSNLGRTETREVLGQY